MRPLAESPWKQRGLYFLAGAVFAFICGFIQYKWMDVVPYTAFDQQPGWLKGLKRLVGWLPWIAFAIVLVFRFVKGRHVRAGFYFIGTSTPTVLLIGWLLFGVSVADLYHRQEFNAEVWQNQEKIEHDIMWPPRLCMVDHLMSSGQLDGLTSNHVIHLLGPPSDESFPYGAKSCDIHYYLGPERGFFRVDSEWLFITFGDDGKVDRYWLYRD
jgi:hypothetical protein